LSDKKEKMLSPAKEVRLFAKRELADNGPIMKKSARMASRFQEMIETGRNASDDSSLPASVRQIYADALLRLESEFGQLN